MLNIGIKNEASTEWESVTVSSYVQCLVIQFSPNKFGLIFDRADRAQHVFQLVILPFYDHLFPHEGRTPHDVNYRQWIVVHDALPAAVVVDLEGKLHCFPGKYCSSRRHHLPALPLNPKRHKDTCFICPLNA